MHGSRLFLMILFILAVYLVPLGVRPLISPDEVRYAEIAREMIVSGDWIVPHLNGVRYFEKPVLGYWAFAGSMKCFGMNAFALRLPAIISTFLTVLFLLFLMRQFRCRLRESFLCAAVFITMPLVVLLSGVGILDGMFSLLLTLCTGTFLLMLEYTERKWLKILLLLLCGVFAGGAFLIKGFLAFALPALIAGCYLIWNKRWKELFILPWLPLFSAFLVIAPWAWLIHRAEPDFWNYFIVVEHWQRFFGGEKAQHAKSAFYFIPVLLGGAAVWIPFLPAVVIGLKNRLFSNPALKFSFCWFLVPFIFLSCSSGKLGSYILPCFPPLAILIASGLAEWTRIRKLAKLPDWITRTLAVCTGILLIGLTVNFFCGFPIRPLFRWNETWQWSILMICGILSVLAFLTVSSERTLWGKLRWYILSLFPLVFASFCVFPECFAEPKCPVTFLEKIRTLPPGCTLVSLHYPFQAACWFYKRDDVFMISPGEIEYGLKYPEAKHRLLSPKKLNQLIRERRGENGVVLIMATNRYKSWVEKKHILEKPTEEIHGSNDDCTSVIFYQ